MMIKNIGKGKENIPFGLNTKTFSLCGVYPCTEFHRYPILLRIDEALYLSQIDKKYRLQKVFNSYDFWLSSQKIMEYNKQWTEHLNFNSHEFRTKK